MSWTRSPAARAGVTGAAGAALVLAALVPPSPLGSQASWTDDNTAPSTLAAGVLPIPVPVTADDIAAAEAARDQLRAARATERTEPVTEKRSGQRAARSQARGATPKAASKTASKTAPKAAPLVVGERFTTSPLNVRNAPDGALVTVLDAGTAVAITDRTSGDWQQIQLDGTNLWVSGQYLSLTKPAAPAVTAPAAGPSGASCSSGSGVESGLNANAIAVHRAVCGSYPQITSYGGYRPDGGFHGSGQAIDIMVSGPLGWDVANWLRANAGVLGISEVIHSQQIWTVQRGGEGWRPMSDRGSATANHYDHVHVSVY